MDKCPETLINYAKGHRQNSNECIVLREFFCPKTVTLPEYIDPHEKAEGKKLYDYQIQAIEKIFDRFNKFPDRYSLLFQLPTGGGKTVIFSEIAKRYIQENDKKVLILTHRIELLGQTSGMLEEFGVRCKMINSKVRDLPDKADYMCFVAMVETLNNRLNEEKMDMRDIGLVIIDEAHYNSFRKLLKFFEKAIILGVTATPLSSNIKLPLKDNYHELITGESIADLVEKGFLSKANAYRYDVHLHSLRVGITGDYTVSSSEKLYGNFYMQEKLLYAYEEVAMGSKTLIFNNGINTSKTVYELFKQAGYDIRHLDNTHSEAERREILDWFREKPNAILTSVSILTTGFDEPTVNTIILNRATRSLTLYHQMIGRGSRRLDNKSEFTVIDLGNNSRRFGPWTGYINWQDIFRSPNSYLDNIRTDVEIELEFTYQMPASVRKRFAHTENFSFDMREAYVRALRNGQKPQAAIDEAIAHHTEIIEANSKDTAEAMELMKLLSEDVDYRMKEYCRCIAKSTENYTKWITEEYNRKLAQNLRKRMME